MAHPNTIVPVDNQIQSTNSLIPRHPFSCSLIGPRGTSKTTVVVNMLTNPSIFRGYFHKIIIMSPSIRLDTKWAALMKEKRILARNRAIPASNRIDLFGMTPRPYDSGRIDPECVYNEYRQDILQDLIKEQEEDFELYGDNMNKVLVIIDDAPALDVFNTKKDNLYNKLAVYLRHVRISCIQVTQNFKSMPRIVRNNQSNLLLFRTENTGELKKVWEEYNLTSTFKGFLNLYNSLTKERFSFIHVNTQNDPKHQLISCLTRYIAR